MTEISDSLAVPKHLAIIMDGNGRWANKRGLERLQGHKSGVEAVKRIVKAARNFNIEYLTLYSFSTENWSRPKQEVRELMNLLKLFIRKDLAELHQNDVRLRIIGDRENLPKDIAPLLLDAEKLTKNNLSQNLIIAFNYGSRNEISRAVQRISKKIEEGTLSRNLIDDELISENLDTAGIPDPDLILRTSGEQRLSNFLLWQAAYSEFIFTDKMWPEFTEEDLKHAIEEFSSRVRRYGGLKSNTAHAQ